MLLFLYFGDNDAYKIPLGANCAYFFLNYDGKFVQLAPNKMHFLQHCRKIVANKVPWH